jgi:hypothetical protein
MSLQHRSGDDLFLTLFDGSTITPGLRKPIRSGTCNAAIKA